MKKIEKPESVNSDFFDKINVEFGKLYGEIDRPNSETRKIGKYLKKSKNEIEKDILEKINILDSFDFHRRISELTNNFHSWFPNGWYRDFKLNLESVTPKKRKLILKTVNSLDQIILQNDIGDDDAGKIHTINTMSDSVKKKELREITGYIYLKMLDKGFLKKDLIG